VKEGKGRREGSEGRNEVKEGRKGGRKGRTSSTAPMSPPDHQKEKEGRKEEINEDRKGRVGRN
jgi:hypothetical protein